MDMRCALHGGEVLPVHGSRMRWASCAQVGLCPSDVCLGKQRHTAQALSPAQAHAASAGRRTCGVLRKGDDAERARAARRALARQALQLLLRAAAPRAESSPHVRPCVVC